MQHNVIVVMLFVTRFNFSRPFPFVVQIVALSKVKDVDLCSRHQGPGLCTCREELDRRRLSELEHQPGVLHGLLGQSTVQVLEWRLLHVQDCSCAAELRAASSVSPSELLLVTPFRSDASSRKRLHLPNF